MVILNVKQIRHLHETLSAKEFWSLLKLDFHIQRFWFDVLVDVQDQIFDVLHCILMFQNISVVCSLDDVMVDLKIILILFSSKYFKYFQ
jgi:hypothetical protein